MIMPMIRLGRIGRFALVVATALAVQAAQAGVVRDHPGHWLGELKTPDGRTLKIGAELFIRADGSPWASFASPDQDAYDVPINGMREEAGSVDLDLGFATMTLVWAGDHFDAEYRQGPTPAALALRQVAAFPAKARPQTPKAPFPYRDETLAIASDGVTLGATLSMPNGVRRPNVVVLVHGSGPGTRDEHIAGHRQLAVLADYLARRGIAVLRYDKRGIARSTGDFEQHTLVELGADLRAVVRAVRARGQFGRLGLVGQSEGSQIAAAVAAAQPGAVDFVISLAGVGLPGIDMLLLQDKFAAQDHGASTADVARLMPYVREFYATVVAQAEAAPRIAALRALHDRVSPDDQVLLTKYGMDQGTLSLDWAGKPFLRASLMSDPRSDWRAVRVPVLALNGSLDHQVAASENLAGIAAALRGGGNRRVETAILPSLNHLLQTARTGSPEEYAEIEETLAPAALERIAAFARKQR
jgi:pimeloyl-ACP methyl ester carboxylesterase